MNTFRRRGLLTFVVLLIGLLVAACGGGSGPVGGGTGGTGNGGGGSPGFTPKGTLGEIKVSVDGGPEILHHVLVLDLGPVELPNASWGRREHIDGSDDDEMGAGNWVGETTRITVQGHRSKDAVPDEGAVNFLLFLDDDDEIFVHPEYGDVTGSIGRVGHAAETIINGDVTITDGPNYHSDGIHMDISGEFTAELIPTTDYLANNRDNPIPMRAEFSFTATRFDKLGQMN